MTTGQQLHIFRKAFGLTLFGFGLVWLAAETRSVAVLGQVFHPWHMMVSALLMFCGGYLMNPPDAEGIADALAKRLPVIRSLWPGGMRATDPPPQANVPPPPSVTGDHSDITPKIPPTAPLPKSDEKGD